MVETLSLKGQKTLLEWDEAYESKVKRYGVYCPCCAEVMVRSDVYSEVDCPKNGSNLYECKNCGNVSLIWFKDVDEWESHLTLKPIKKSLLVLGCIMIGFFFAWQLAVWRII